MRSADSPITSPAFIDGFHNLEFDTQDDVSFRWTNGNGALPPSLFPPWLGKTLLRVPLIHGHGQGGAADEPLVPAAVLLSAFESLGDDCELALAQRHYGAEPPLTLLRWSGTTYEKLLRGLETRFDGLDDPATAKVVWELSDYRLRTPFLSFHTSVNEPRDADGVAEILSAGCATLRLLRRKLLKDIGGARRIFVYKDGEGTLGEAGMHRLHAALRTIGPASLLCVTRKPPHHANGDVERIGDGLYAGYLEKFVIPNGPFDEWLALCSRTMSLHYG